MLSLSINFQRVGIPTRSKGFSLIEMAVVMVIVGLLLSGLFVALGDSAANRNRITATADLEGIKEAFYGFAQATGRLPCPAVVASAGVEAPNGGGACTRAHGFIPAVTLGLQGAVDSNGLLLDPWGNPYRYSVSDLLSGGNRSFTTTNGLRSQFAVGALTASANLLCIAGATACAAPIYVNTVPALIYSMGADWAIYTSAVQLENASTPLVSGFRMATDNNFVNGIYAEEGSNAFDDILVWLSPNILYSRLITAGKLP
jgi:prepilin-type N-terminal cleavage/methylation domain-containing protein